MKRNITNGQKVEEPKLFLARKMRTNPTPEEEKLWQELRRGKLGVHFRRQQVIYGFIVDFYCAKAGLVIECDGSFHISENDEVRDNILSTNQLIIKRFTNQEINENLTGVLGQIREVIDSQIDKSC